MDAQIDLSRCASIDGECPDVSVEFGNMIHDVELKFGPLELYLSYELTEKLYLELKPYFCVEDPTSPAPPTEAL